jgi:galactose oxidase
VTSNPSAILLTLLKAKMAASEIGKWDDEFQLKNVAIHAHLLPTGKILYWGRRSDTKSRALDSLDEHKTMSYILDLDTPEKLSSPAWNSPRDTKGSEVNLFCSGHTFLPNGTLMVVGGHWQDGMGIDQVSVFDPFSTKGAGGEWIPMPPMGRGRWYPSAISLPNGNVLVVSGAGGGNTDPNPQLWRANKWDPVAYNDRITLYPRLSLDPAGSVFMAGPQSVSQWLHQHRRHLEIANPQATRWSARVRPFGHVSERQGHLHRRRSRHQCSA